MNYTEMVAAVKAYADRNDAEVNAAIDTFIMMAEARINRKLRVSEMTTRASVATLEDKEYYSLPSDFSGIRDIELQDTAGARHVIDYMPPNQMNMVHGYNVVDLPGYYYTIIAGNLHVLPIIGAGAAIEIVYYQKLPHLDGNVNETNWVSEIYPDIYVSALMIEIEKFVKNKEAVEFWKAEFNEATAALTSADSVDRWSGPPLMIRTQ